MSKSICQRCGLIHDEVDIKTSVKTGWFDTVIEGMEAEQEQEREHCQWTCKRCGQTHEWFGKQVKAEEKGFRDPEDGDEQ